MLNTLRKSDRKKFRIILLGLIIFLATILRFVRLDSVPGELFGDEIDVGYQAYSILETGRDYRGQLLPSYIHSLTEWRAPLYLYSTVPSVALLGLNEWGVRFPAALFGILTVLISFFLIRELFKDEKLALLTAFLMAFNPWSIHYSRAGFEVTLLLFLVSSGFLCFFKGLRKPKLLVLSAFLFSLSLYAYNTANIFLPLMFLVLGILYFKPLLKLEKKWLVLSVFLFLLVSAPLIKNIFLGDAASRFGLISVFSNEKMVDEINLTRVEVLVSGQDFSMIPLTEKVFHNRPLYWFLEISENYFSSLSPKFLFSSGDPNIRHSVPRVGQLYVVEAIFVVLGFWFLLKRKEKEKWFLFSFLLFAPIPSALTQGGGNHATRLFLMVLPLVFLSALGFLGLINMIKLKKKYILFLVPAVLLAGLIFNFFFFFHQYFVHYEKQSWKLWSYGYKEIMTELALHEKDFDRVFINNTYEPALIRYLFWTKYPPLKFQEKFEKDIPKEGVVDGFNGFNLENVYFGSTQKSDGWWSELLDEKTLYLAVQGLEVAGDWDWNREPPQGIKVLETARNPRGENLFYLVTHE